METPPPSPLDLSAGFLAFARGLVRWPLFQSLSAHGRMVVVVLLLRAQFKPSEIWIAGHRVVLQPGQLIDSEEEIARLCGRGVSRKVVRTTLARLAEGGFLVRRPALRAGQCPHVITICDYALLQPRASDEGPQKGPRLGQQRASDGPAVGLQGAPLEQGEPQEPREPSEPLNSPVVEAHASDDAEPFGRLVEVWDRICVPAGFARARSTPQQRKAARARMREDGWFEAFEAACAYMAREPFYRGGSTSGWVATLGWLLKPGNTEKTAERAATVKAAGNGAAACVAPAASPDKFTQTGARELPEVA